MMEEKKLPATVNSTSPSTPMAMLQRAVESGATVETLDKLLALQERWEKAQGRKSFDAAISAAKTEIPVVIRNRIGHNQKRYADFAAMARAVDPVLGAHGLAYRFRTVQDDKNIRVTCVLSHRDGHYEETTLAGPADTSGNKNAIQAIGSTLTYLQRYSLTQALGLAAADDDDGNAAGIGETITQEQADQIGDALEASGKSREKFLKWAKIERLEDLPLAMFGTALEAAKYKRATA